MTLSKNGVWVAIAAQRKLYGSISTAVSHSTRIVTCKSFGIFKLAASARCELNEM